MTPVRWGILSTARIATQKVVPALRKSAAHEVAAIASRALPTARAAADALGIATAHGSYEALIDDPTIEAIYNPLPNPMHVPLTLAAVRAGKHVLCEKPFALHAAELDGLRPYADKVHIREAFMVRRHPQWHAVRAHVRAGDIGSLRFMQVPFSYFNDDAANIRNQAALGGGALYDIGCYAITAGRWFFEAEPEQAVALIDTDPAFGTDRLTSGLLGFAGGGQLAFSVSTQSVRFQRAQLVGTTGRIEIEIPFNAPPDRVTRLFVDTGADLFGTGKRMEEFSICDQYTIQGDLFSLALCTDGAVPTPLEDSVANMRAIEAIARSAESGRWETV